MTHNFYENEYGCIYYDKVLTTPVGRVNFLNVATPGKKFGKYSATLYIDKNSVQEQAQLQLFQELTNATGELLQAKFGDAQHPAKYPAFRDGDVGKQANVAAANGNWVIVANNARNQPDVFDSEQNDFDVRQLKAGMLCRLVVKPATNDDGIFYQLEGVQVIGDDGVYFRTGPNARQIAGTVPGGLVVGGGTPAIASPAGAAPAQPSVAQAVQPIAQPAAPAPQPAAPVAAAPVAAAQPVAAAPAAAPVAAAPAAAPQPAAPVTAEAVDPALGALDLV